jgi:hypothetical protein
MDRPALPDVQMGSFTAASQSIRFACKPLAGGQLGLFGFHLTGIYDDTFLGSSRLSRSVDQVDYGPPNPSSHFRSADGRHRLLLHQGTGLR